MSPASVPRPRIPIAVFASASLGMVFLMARHARTLGGVAIGTALAVLAAGAAAWAIRPPAPWQDDPAAPDRSPYRARDASGLALAPRVSRGGTLVPLLLGVLFTVPTMGIMGLWDPWETHYGEVAREILARSDWISLWWQDEWFDSKPILVFWLTAWSMSIFGMDYHPDGQPAAAEWAVRFPVVVLSIGLVVVVARTARRYWGDRAGALAAVALVSTPYFCFLSHQAITDMPFVATMTIALCALVVAVHTPEDEPAHRLRVPWRGGPIEVTTLHCVVAAFVFSVWPQILYLVTRNFTLLGPNEVAFHLDTFFSGSGENGRPRPEVPAFAFEPALQALTWTGAAAGALAAMRRTHAQRGVLLWTFYLFVAYSAMAKGIPGFAVPGLVALAFLVVTGRWSLLRRLQIPSGALAAATVILPWFVAMYVRHGPRFTDRLLVHDHVNRLLVGVHGDTGTVRYFLAQLGYGAFPWIALAPAAILAWAPLRRGALSTPAGEARLYFSLAAALSFALFSAMVTKFHHYLFPMVPPLAILVAAFADEITPAEPEASWRRRAGRALAAFAWAGLAVGSVALAVEGRLLLSAALGAGVLATAVTVVARSKPPREKGAAPVAALLVGAAVLAGFVARDYAMQPSSRPRGLELLVNLFIYNYDRQFPAGFDHFVPWLVGFGAVAAATLAALAWPRARGASLHAFAGVSLLFGGWVVYVYMWQLTPHWSQRDFIASYYRERESPEERLVAWQMNWKGENFYTGNRVVVYVSLDNDAFERWIERHRGERHFFCTERPRLESLRRTLGKSAAEAPVVDDSNNKYIMVRARL
jgi:4-amino-4-deoxy-L-arabinose transferase-like glycosyltransferase